MGSHFHSEPLSYYISNPARLFVRCSWAISQLPSEICANCFVLVILCHKCDISIVACNKSMAVNVNAMEQQEVTISAIPDVLEDFFLLFHVLIQKVGSQVNCL